MRIAKFSRVFFAVSCVSGLAACASTGGSEAQLSNATGIEQASPRITNASSHLQCVPYARNQSGIHIYGNASVWWEKAKQTHMRGNRPTKGSVLVLKTGRGGNRGHLAVVRKIVSSREIIVDHANWLNQGRIHNDTPVYDVSPGNDWSEVRVWYTPGQQYGVKVYAARGFIYRDNRDSREARL